MYYTSAIPEVRFGLESENRRADYTAAGTGDHSGRRTIDVAATMSVAPFVVLVAARYPVAVAGIVAATISVFAASRYRRRAVPPDDSTPRSCHGKSERNRSVSSD
jgi:hypothetical protein